MSEQQTTFGNKCAILAELWLNYRDDPDFIDFIEYNDLGLPLAYAVDSSIIESNDKVAVFINEAWDLFLSGLEATDTGFESLDELLGLAEEE
jgi:hypothetical protein